MDLHRRAGTGNCLPKSRQHVFCATVSVLWSRVLQSLLPAPLGSPLHVIMLSSRLVAAAAVLALVAAGPALAQLQGQVIFNQASGELEAGVTRASVRLEWGH